MNQKKNNIYPEHFINEKPITTYNSKRPDGFSAPMAATETQKKIQMFLQRYKEEICNDQSSKDIFVRHVKELAELPQSRLSYFETLQEENQNLRKENERLHKENGDEANDKMNLFHYIDNLNEKKATIRYLCEEIETVKNENVENSKNLHREITKLSEENAKNNVKIENFTVEIARKDCFLLETNRETRKLSEELKNERLGNFHLSEMNKSLENTIGNLLEKNQHKNSNEMNRLRERNKRLQTEHEDIIKKIGETLREKNSNLQRRNDELLKEKNKIANEKEMICKEKKTELKKVRDENDQLLEGIKMVKSKMQNFDEKYSKITKENTEFQAENEKLHKQIADYKEVQENIKFKMDVVKEVQQLRTKIKQLEREKRDLTKENGQFRQKLTLQEEGKTDDAHVRKNGKMVSKTADFVKKPPEEKLEKSTRKKKGQKIIVKWYSEKLTNWKMNAYLFFFVSISLPFVIFLIVFVSEFFKV
jgi:chromosome segregation ATPase